MYTTEMIAGHCSACVTSGCNVHHKSNEFASPGRLGRSLPGSASLDWQLPMPPIRFPLRDALLSFNEGTRSSSPRSASAAAAAMAAKGPLLVRSTEKSRASREMGQRRRQGSEFTFADEAPQQPPRVPPDQPRHAKKSMMSLGTIRRVSNLKVAEQAGTSTWSTALKESHSSPELQSTSISTQGGIHTQDVMVRDTWTSAARTVLSHSRRHAGATLPDETSVFSGWSSLQACQGLPKSVMELSAKGLEFTDKGFGVAERFDPELRSLAQRAPGHIYSQQEYGSVSRWRRQSSLPTKQPCSHHYSAETHRMGARRDTSNGDGHRPGPGAYEFKGFADVLIAKNAK